MSELIQNPENSLERWQTQMSEAADAYRQEMPHSTVSAGVTISQNGLILRQTALPNFDREQLLLSTGKLFWGAYAASQISQNPELQYVRTANEVYSSESSRPSIKSTLASFAGSILPSRYRPPTYIEAMQTMLHGEGQASNIATVQIKQGLSNYIKKAHIADEVETWLRTKGIEAVVQGSNSVFPQGRRGNIASPKTMVKLFNSMIFNPNSLDIHGDGHSLVTQPLLSQTAYTHGLDIATSNYPKNSWGKSGWDPKFDPRELPNSAQASLVEATQLSLDEMPDLDCNHRLEGINMGNGTTVTFALFTETPIFTQTNAQTKETIKRVLHKPFRGLI